MRPYRLSLLLTLAITSVANAQASQPASSQKIDASLPWSQRMADSILLRHPNPHTIESPTGALKWSYSTAFCVRAVTEVGIKNPGPHPEADESNKYVKYGRDYMSAFVRPDGTLTVYDPKGYRLDDIAPGVLLLDLDQWWSSQLASSTEQGRYGKAAAHLADQLKTQPRVDGGGFWHKTIYPNQMWLDGIFMDCPFMARFGKLTNNPQYFDEVATQILLLAQHAQDEKTGLLYHGWDASKKERWADPATGLSKNFWGRGMGWYLAGIVDSLDYLPENHPKRNDILAVLKKACAGLDKVQDPATGLWYQVLDQGSRPGNYLESSASCMFTYVLAKASRLNYIDAHFADTAKKAYAGILKNQITTDAATGALTLKDTCQVAGLGANPYRDGTYEYYLSEPRVSNDPKGLAPFILASLELEGKK